MPKIIDWFVNRTKQYDFFWKMSSLETPKRILLVEAPTQMGKTWLVQRLYHECSIKKMPVALFNFHDRRAWDYLTLVRQARDQMGAEPFNALTAVINGVTSVNLQMPSGASGNVDLKVATNGGQISGSSVNVGDVAGGNIVKDNFFFIQNDSAIARQQIELRITDAFISCLTALTQTQSTVLLFDSYEELEANAEADQWLRTNLFTRVRDGKLPNVVVVIAGQTVPQLDDAYSDCKIITRLDLFEEQHVADYLKRRGLDALDANTIFSVSKGQPGFLAMLADNATAKKDDEL